MTPVLRWLSRRFTEGRLDIRFDDGQECSIGSGPRAARLRFKDRATLHWVLRGPQMRFPEAYVEGHWEPEDDLLSVLEVAMRNSSHLLSRRTRALRVLRARLGELNSAVSAKRNIQHHYDIDTPVYRLFLDQDLHYSCAYFEQPELSLEAAQQAKCALIARKLDLRPGAHVLDIGCGWGSNALYLARHFDVEVTGVTLSENQCAIARERAEAAGLADRVHFRLEDYRQTQGPFDAIVSIGMFEHVGRPQYPVFFRRVHELLTDDGVALLHTIGSRHPPDQGSPWIRKYIFPGGQIPAASEIMSPLEKSGLWMTDLEVLRLHYARTLSHWHARFQQNRAAIAEIMGERFCRMWRFYLQASEATFRWGGLAVFQLQLARTVDRLPLTRNYLFSDTVLG
ncbi:class I SAM-dependent methyltransferase [Algiphilus sp. NNCM1]|uniref:SAM-dependent methyltransferase n=1 Tax=Algiphilus sp. TaxID=1872431 RepID=UPI001CA76CED|nr:cyclopropane-fatty-acyl-phospholipid synthase family protein [Algiphilus sp.]MBY8966083.1 class I SAM-dependent methyltransferase [Algiphilus acroporae]MCI5062831.1 cyclopropane-fatty-acyl-phospholipid synthase family protein [Algiphilus sp.]MCI5104881.1 cyclopropane-fatty-acyl-phospholipid synthase family protein [Algiphilus sp.]